MPYVANKRMNLAGTDYPKGTPVSDKTFHEIPTYRQGALLRQRLIIEVESLPTPPGEMCPHCDKGPFKRLEQHISLKHQADVSVSAEIPEESDGNS